MCIYMYVCIYSYMRLVSRFAQGRAITLKPTAAHNRHIYERNRLIGDAMRNGVGLSALATRSARRSSARRALWLDPEGEMRYNFYAAAG